MMVRTNITVPEELKTEMDKLPHINWSGVARRAFELEIQCQPKKAQAIQKTLMLHFVPQKNQWRSVTGQSMWRTVEDGP